MSNAAYKTRALKQVAYYSKERIDVSLLDEENYIGTDNLLQNKQGKQKSSYVPTNGTVTQYSPNDTLVANIRPYLEKIWFADRTGGASSDVLTFKVKPGYDPKFFYYSLFRDEFFDHMMLGSKGTRMPRGSKVQILEYPVPDIELAEQKKIAGILSLIDSKIQLNNRINDELEVIAKTLYDYWFVQFDFPDENGKPYKSSGGKLVWSEELNKEIPDGWIIKKMKDLLPVITGKQDANFATENGRYKFFTCGEEILRCDAYEFEGKAVLVAGNGNFSVKMYDGKFNAYQRTYVLIPKNQDYFTVIYMAVKDRIQSLTKGSRGSIIKFITKADLEDIKVVIPQGKNLDLFSELNALSKQIGQLIEENQKLAELRNWLLPMLMNGQVTIDKS
jgi:type I restriction enzyme S subunit